MVPFEIESMVNKRSSECLTLADAEVPSVGRVVMTRRRELSMTLERVVWAVEESHAADVLLYNAPVGREFDSCVSDLSAKKRHKNVLLIMVTEGGDADAAYRIAKCLQRNYETVRCLVAGYCKSAGTLIALGAHELIMGDDGELGPLDVQMHRTDDWGASSGLTVTSSLQAMQAQAQRMFNSIVLDLERNMQHIFSAKTAGEIASKITVGALQPIFSQIEAMHIGEAGRALNVAKYYGRRLAAATENLREGALEQLLVGYPSHGYVIDREEAEKLFVNIRKTREDEDALIGALGNLALIPTTAFGQSERIEFLKGVKDDDSTSNKGTDGTDTGRQNTETAGGTAGGNATAAPASEGVSGGGGADVLSSRN